LETAQSVAVEYEDEKFDDDPFEDAGAKDSLAAKAKGPALESRQEGDGDWF
jgi:hypothetical protein